MRRPCLALLLVVVATACSSASADSRPPTALAAHVHACSLLRAADVADVVGRPVVRLSVATEDMCGYRLRGRSSLEWRAHVAIFARRGTSEERSGMRKGRSTPEVRVTRLDGLGEMARLIRSTDQPVVTADVLDGGVAFAVSVTTPLRPDAEIDRVAVALARRVDTRVRSAAA